MKCARRGCRKNIEPPQRKYCSRACRMKNRSGYYFDYYRQNRQHRIEYNRQRHRRIGAGKSDHWRAVNLQRQYGLTIERYDGMLVAQGGVCAICGNPPKKRRLCVDHDHKTGKVRGLLCFRCNYGLSWFRDKPELFDTAAGYLRLQGRRVA